MGEQVNTLEKELKLKQAELAKTKNENMDAERNLKKLSSKKEHEVGDNIEQYDKSMEELNEEIMALTEQYSAEKARMRRLENHFEAFRLIEGADSALTCRRQTSWRRRRKRSGLVTRPCSFRTRCAGTRGAKPFSRPRRRAARARRKNRRGKEYGVECYHTAIWQKRGLPYHC